MESSGDKVLASGGTNLLDCTFRDGGYYTSWQFPLGIVQKYLYAMRDSRVEWVEIGFRSGSDKGYKGATAFSRDNFLGNLDVPEGIRLAVMVNASEVVESGDPDKLMNRLFSSQAESKVSLVRLACQIWEIEEATRAADALRALGYKVAMNIMQFTEFNEADLSRGISKIPQEVVEIVYLADSLGKALPSDVESAISNTLDAWGGSVGFHGHDNRGFALANSHYAANAGATWIDGTVTGIGRGAGNTRTELLLGHFARRDGDPPNTSQLEDLIEEFFGPLQNEMQWGPNIHYARAASRGIHPTFVQELLDNSAYSSLEISAAIDQLGASDSTRFEPRQLETIDTLLNQANSPKSGWNQSELFHEKTVLLVGGGLSIRDHSLALEQLAGSPEIFVIAANLGPAFLTANLDAHVACNPLRLMADSREYAKRGSTLIAPQGLIPEQDREAIESHGKLLDVGLSIDGQECRGEAGIIFLPKPNVLAYGLLTALTGGARTIYLAGFDGYGEGDSRRKPEQEMVDQILRLPLSCDLKAITPTSLNFPQSSIYAL